jgi:crotonobetainyl-CoA:carnitine CoA-transferase CaiB-like acyl-CoA transferase
MSQAASPPLEGLRVLELASGVAGPYAGRLLALLGAEIVKVEPAGGDPARAHRVDDRPLAGPSPLFLHLNAGKRCLPRARADLPALLGWAQVVIDDRVRAELDPRGVLEAGPAPRVLASVTPWGFEASTGGSIADELLAQAVSGALVADTEADRPRRFPGWQAQYMAGAYAATGALALLAGGGARHLDVAWTTALLSGVEGAVSVALHGSRARSERDPQAGIQYGAFPSGVFACADGHVIPGSVRPVDWTLQCQVYGRPDLLEDPRFERRNRLRNHAELRALLAPWYAARGKREIFRAALEAGWAAAMVLTPRDALADEHLRAREFLGEASHGGRRFALPAAPWRGEGMPCARTRVSGGADGATMRELVATDAVRAAPPPLSGVRVLEMTRAWAGPFVGRFLGAFGADVVKLEAARSPDGWRARLRWRDAGVALPPGTDPDGYTWDAAALYNGLNRNKRGLSLDLTRPGARDLVLSLVEKVDVLVVNMTHRVLADFGLEYDVLARANPRLVLVNMPALGASGPYRAMPGYGMLIEGMGGFAARFGDRSEPARATATYYPDAVAGVHATLAALSALAARERTGRGGAIDLSQQETTWMMLGEGIALASLEGRDPDRVGDAEPGCWPSGLYPTADGWLALVVQDDAERARLIACAGGALDGIETRRLDERDAIDATVASWTRAAKTADLERELRSRGVRARAVFDFRRDALPPELAALDPYESLAHPVTATRAYLRIPLRVDGAALSSRAPAPVFDQDTDEIVAALAAASAADRARLRAERVIGGTPGELLAARRARSG